MAIDVQLERQPSVARPRLYVLEQDAQQHAPSDDTRRAALRHRRLARRARMAVEAAIWVAGSACLALVVLFGAAGLLR